MSQAGEQVREMFGSYTTEIDVALATVFADLPDYELYKHSVYFVGFLDENLKPQEAYGGKRFRSSLALMLGDWYGHKAATLPIAVSIELFHNFTLIHDDIVDGDELRRGRPTVWKLFGTEHAINSGDAQLLLSLEVVLASDHLTAQQKIETMNFLSKQYRKVTEGQFLDFTLTDAVLDASVSKERYMEMIGRKTADLIAAATGVSGLIAKVDETEQAALFEFGYSLGLAYQLCDDVVSIWGTNAVTGKRECGDIIERKKTFPILLLLEKLAESDTKRLLEIYAKLEAVSETEVSEVLELLNKEGVYDVAYAEVQHHANKAKQAVSTLSLSDTQKESLAEFVDLLLPSIRNQ